MKTKMNFIISTKIKAKSKEAVMAKFTSELFILLAPPFPKIKLLRFDGSEKGNEIHLEMHVIFFKTEWISLITDHVSKENQIYFIDEGTSIPAPIKYWRHRHVIRNANAILFIDDDLTFTSGNKIVDILLFPFVYGLLFYRKPIYKKYFNTL